MANFPLKKMFNSFFWFWTWAQEAHQCCRPIGPSKLPDWVGMCLFMKFLGNWVFWEGFSPRIFYTKFRSKKSAFPLFEDPLLMKMKTALDSSKSSLWIFHMQKNHSFHFIPGSFALLAPISKFLGTNITNRPPSLRWFQLDFYSSTFSRPTGDAKNLSWHTGEIPFSHLFVWKSWKGVEFWKNISWGGWPTYPLFVYQTRAI